MLKKTYLIAEISANHLGSLDLTLQTIEAAAQAGADAVKIQTYTPDTLTLDCDTELFRSKNPLRNGRTLYSIYAEGAMPWDWTAQLMEYAQNLGLEFFSTPFDATAVDFLEQCNVAKYKIASFELVDIPLLKKVATTGKPVIMSTGMGTLAEIDEAVRTLRQHGTEDITLLKCTSSYPAPVEEAHLRTIPHMAEAFQCPVGLSDHTLGSAVAIAAVALGATVIEKHFIFSRADGGLDASFSMEPHEFKRMAEDIRTVEKALGHVNYERTEKECLSVGLRRSLFVVKDIKMGELFTEENVRSIRPGQGLHTRYLDAVLGKMARQNISKGTPLHIDMF